MNKRFFALTFSLIFLIMALIVCIYKVSNNKGSIKVNIFSPFVIDVVK